VTYAELSRKLRALVNRSAVIAKHAGDIPAGTLRVILKQLDIQREGLESR
jgi:hypothetical protein